MALVKKALLVVLLLLSASAVLAESVITQRVVNVHRYLKGATTLTFMGQLGEEAMAEIAGGKSMAVYNFIDSYLTFPIALAETKGGLGLDYGFITAAVNFKNGKVQWAEKDLADCFAFSVGKELVKPSSAFLKSSGTVQKEELTELSGKKLTFLDIIENESGGRTLAALNFTLSQKGKNYKFNCKENGIQAKVSVNSKGKITASFKLSPDVVSLASVESEDYMRNKYDYSLEVVGDGNVESGFVGSDLVTFRVTEKADKFRFFAYNGVKITNAFLALNLKEDTAVTAVFGNYDLETVARGDGLVETEFTGPDEVRLRAVGKEDVFDNFSWGNKIEYKSPLTITLVSDTVVTATFTRADYLVIDLSGGYKAKKWPYRITNSGPNLDDDACRTTELWLRYLPPGEFAMGSPQTEVGRGDREELHTVTISKGFYIGVFEITIKQYEIVTDSNPSIHSGKVLPITMVNYGQIRGVDQGLNWPVDDEVDAISFMGIIRTKTGLRFDLPTEAQWEFACRAGTATAFNNGQNIDDQNFDLKSYAYYSENASDIKKVGSLKPNKWGLYDMHGNAWEWCLDWYTAYLGHFHQTDPKGPAGGSTKILRGGSFNDKKEQCRSAYRSYTEIYHTMDRTGFRAVINQQ